MTLHVAVLSPSALLAVMTASPAATAVTVPFDTETIPTGSHDQTTVPAAEAGVTVAVMTEVFPTAISILVLSKDKPVTFSVTLIVHDAVFCPSRVCAVT